MLAAYWVVTEVSLVEPGLPSSRCIAWTHGVRARQGMSHSQPTETVPQSLAFPVLWYRTMCMVITCAGSTQNKGHPFSVPHPILSGGLLQA